MQPPLAMSGTRVAGASFNHPTMNLQPSSTLLSPFSTRNLVLTFPKFGIIVPNIIFKSRRITRRTPAKRAYLRNPCVTRPIHHSAIRIPQSAMIHSPLTMIHSPFTIFFLPHNLLSSFLCVPSRSTLRGLCPPRSALAGLCLIKYFLEPFPFLLPIRTAFRMSFFTKGIYLNLGSNACFTRENHSNLLFPRELLAAKESPLPPPPISNFRSKIENPPPFTIHHSLFPIHHPPFTPLHPFII
jgi:hypothetical protein